MAALWTCLAVLCLAGSTQGWQLMLKVPRESDMGGAHSVYDLWTSNMTLNPNEQDAIGITPGVPFKSADVLDWDNKSISLVSLYMTGKCKR